MQDDSTVWNSIFAREGIVFSHPFDDVRHLADLFSQRGTQTILDPGCRTGWHVPVSKVVLAFALWMCHA